MMKSCYVSIFSRVWQKMVLLVVLGFFFIFMSSWLNNVMFFEFVMWDLGGSVFSIDFLLDYISLMFVGTIMIISGSVIMYCYWYMDNEVYFLRFMYLVYMFIGSMMFMIMIPNLITLLIGWDGLGLTSFLLVAHYQNSSSLSGSLLTALTNRIGDGLILMSICLWGVYESSWVVYGFNANQVSLFFIISLIFGGMTKSAQMPFCAWLPAAMAAPTPVSSLVHSSTLVTAGVYLLIRCYSVLSLSDVMLNALKMLSLFTLLLASSAAIFCFDMKKIIALSTLSQLSVMMFALSHGLVFVSFFHLVMHALFKALLFLSAGAVIHSMMGSQDIRSMGMVWSKLPFSMSSMFVANCSLSGLPFVSGFFSKDMVLDLTFNSVVNFFCFLIIVPGLMLTSFYSMRMSWMVCYGMSKLPMNTISVKEAKSLLIPYMCLFVGALFMGKILSPLFEGLFFYRNSSLSEMMTLSLLFVFGISYLSVSHGSLSMSIKWRGSMSFLFSMWFLEPLTHLIKNIFFYFSVSVMKGCDKGLLEVVGPKGVYLVSSKVSLYNENYQSDFFLKSMISFSLVFVLILLVLSLY
nr:NADH dehydrogenase subunit 5 [Mytella strigata]